MSTAITYVGNGAFEDTFEPVAGKSEWGMDTLTRVMAGSQPNLVAFISALAQGQRYFWNGNNYYLQTWECDNNPVFPRVTMLYKGLFAGIPAPFVTGMTTEQTQSASTSDPVEITFWDYATQTSVTRKVSATRTTRSIVRRSNYKYITTVRPTAPTYTALDIPYSPQVITSNIITDAGTNYSTNAPAALATALFPSAYNITTTNVVPVFVGPTPQFFECEDEVQQYYN